jgi:hypothetical protein
MPVQGHTHGAMRGAHASISFTAVARMLVRPYFRGMNWTFYLHNPSPATSFSMEHGERGFLDAHAAIQRKALERWENEGGKIPELPVRHKATIRGKRETHGSLT